MTPWVKADDRGSTLGCTRRKEPIPTSYLLTYIHVLYGLWVPTHTIKANPPENAASENIFIGILTQESSVHLNVWHLEKLHGRAGGVDQG